jgi:glycosyltransferase involved in cell wall biosynthesis
MSSDVRIAWFSPLPPTRSGIAAYSAEVVARLSATHAIDCFTEANAGNFVWLSQRTPYDLVVYQLGNAPYHDFMWGYMAAYPGLVVLHDARLHHARARTLLAQGRDDDYRREFWYDHPDAQRDFAEYAVAGLGGPIYYCWPMLRAVVRTARLVAVHNARVAADLREEFLDVGVEAIHLGTAAPAGSDAAGRRRVRATLGVPDHAFLFAAFGKITAEKRIAAILRALDLIAGERDEVHLLLAGDASEFAATASAWPASAHGSRIHVSGYIPEAQIGEYLTAADVCLCLRWPTALETSASWVQCLATGRPTIVTDLAHLVDVPTIDPRSRRSSTESAEPVAIAVDPLNEDESLLLAMRALLDEPPLRDALARAGQAYWSANHTLDLMTRDYEGLIARAAARQAPVVLDLPSHFSDDHSGSARAIADRFGLTLDEVLGSRSGT